MLKTSKTSRRRFVQKASLAGTGLTAVGWSSLIRGESPLGQVRIGVIGTGFRGKYLIGNLPSTARVVAICDCAESQMADTVTPRNEFVGVLERFKTTDAKTCVRYQDYRRMLDTETLDAVIIATPDHHHVLAAMHSLNAGLDVYVEKPLSLTIREGRLLADKVKATGRVLQVGSQQRTMEINRFACEFVRDGGLGKVSRVDVPNYPGPYFSPDQAAQPIPKDLNWDLFLGPAPLRPHSRMLWVKDKFEVDGRMWRGWDLFRDYSGHLMTNWGGHNVDMVQYALGMDSSGPERIEPMDGISESDLAQDFQRKWHNKTPAPSSTFLDDPRFMPIRMTYKNNTELNFVPNVGTATFYGEHGTMSIARNRFTCEPSDLVRDAPGEEVAKRWRGAGHVARPHLENWLDCIVSRDQPNAPVEVGHRTATLCHLAGIARELNRPLNWNPVTEQFDDDQEADKRLDRPRRDGYRLPS